MIEKKILIDTVGYEIRVSGSLIEDGELRVTVNGKEHVFDTSEGKLTVDGEVVRLETEKGYVRQEENKIQISLPDGSYIEKNPFQKIFRDNKTTIKTKNKKSDIKISDLFEFIEISDESIAILSLSIIFYNPFLLIASLFLALEGNMWVISSYVDSISTDTDASHMDNIREQFVSGEITVDEFDDRIENYIREDDNYKEEKIRTEELQKQPSELP